MLENLLHLVIFPLRSRVKVLRCHGNPFSMYPVTYQSIMVRASTLSPFDTIIKFNCFSFNYIGLKTPCNFCLPTCDLGGSCEICPISYKNCFQPPNNCRCNCKGKCAKGLSDAVCNCSDVLSDPLEEYQPTAAQLHRDPDESNSDDDFCECCSCGCEDSDESFSCQCN